MRFLFYVLWKNSLSFPFPDCFDALLQVPDFEGPEQRADFPLPARGIGMAAARSVSLFQIPGDRWRCMISPVSADCHIQPSTASLFPMSTVK